MTVVTFCPYCASEDLWPQVEPQGAWACRSCTRAFVVTKAKIESATSDVADASQASTSNATAELEAQR